MPGVAGDPNAGAPKPPAGLAGVVMAPAPNAGAEVEAAPKAGAEAPDPKAGAELAPLPNAEPPCRDKKKEPKFQHACTPLTPHRVNCAADDRQQISLSK